MRRSRGTPAVHLVNFPAAVPDGDRRDRERKVCRVFLLSKVP